MAVKTLTIGHLYPVEMNIYGDTGNVLVLSKRMEWRGIEPVVKKIGIGDPIPDDIDILVSGGGQDAGQDKVQADLMKKAKKIQKLADKGVPILAICGTYQLLGHRFVTEDGNEIKGIGLFDLETIAGDKRLIGNVTLDTPFGKVVGYENHSGLTSLGEDQKPFGTVVSGEGNNNSDNTEGAIYKNAIGTYMHGPILPKNPQIADNMIKTAYKNKYGEALELKDLDDSLATKASDVAAGRPR